MDEIEKIRYAKGFIDKLARGINPLDGTTIADDDVVNNVRISRCLYFVSEVLGKVCDGEVKPPRKRDKVAFEVTSEIASGLVPVDSALTMTDITAKINALRRTRVWRNFRVQRFPTGYWATIFWKKRLTRAVIAAKFRPKKDGRSAWRAKGARRRTAIIS